MRPPRNWKHAILDTVLFAGTENTDRFELRSVRRVHLMLLGPFFKIGLSSLFGSLNCSQFMPQFVGNHFSPLLYISGVGVKCFSLALVIFPLYTDFTLVH
jgi:hypothetical protein